MPTVGNFNCPNGRISHVTGNEQISTVRSPSISHGLDLGIVKGLNGEDVTQYFRALVDWKRRCDFYMTNHTRCIAVAI